MLRLATQDPITDATYYHICILVDSSWEFDISYTRQWSDQVKGKPFRHLYTPRPVMPRMLDILQSIGEPGSLINVIEDFSIYRAFLGGHAVIEESVLKRTLSPLFDSVEKVFTYTKGEIAVEGLPQAVLQRAPSRKARMDVLKRDRFRCKACGRSPHNNTDIELHVHHIIPWGGGGLTETDNLITLCMTCHDGLDPHYEPRLFELIDKTWNSEDIGSLHDEHVREYAEGVMRYRVKMGRLFEQMAEQKKTSKRLPVVARKRR